MLVINPEGWLAKRHACQAGIAWVRSLGAKRHAARTAWEACGDAGWILWVAAQAGIQAQRVVGVAADLVRQYTTGLPIAEHEAWFLRQTLAFIQAWPEGRGLVPGAADALRHVATHTELQVLLEADLSDDAMLSAQGAASALRSLARVVETASEPEGWCRDAAASDLCRMADALAQSRAHAVVASTQPVGEMYEQELQAAARSASVDMAQAVRRAIPWRDVSGCIFREALHGSTPQ